MFGNNPVAGGHLLVSGRWSDSLCIFNVLCIQYWRSLDYSVLWLQGEGWGRGEGGGGRGWEGVGLVEEGREDVSCIQVQDYQQLTFMVSHTMGGVGEGV